MSKTLPRFNTDSSECSENETGGKNFKIYSNIFQRPSHYDKAHTMLTVYLMLHVGSITRHANFPQSPRASWRVNCSSVILNLPRNLSFTVPRSICKCNSPLIQLDWNMLSYVVIKVIVHKDKGRFQSYANIFQLRTVVMVTAVLHQQVAQRSTSGCKHQVAGGGPHPSSSCEPL